MEYPPPIKVGPDMAGVHMFTLPENVGGHMHDVIPKVDFYEYLADKSQPQDREELERKLKQYCLLHENRRYWSDEYNRAGLAAAHAMKKCLPESVVYFHAYSEHERLDPEEINGA